jgi:hypothetical protein
LTDSTNKLDITIHHDDGSLTQLGIGPRPEAHSSVSITTAGGKSVVHDFPGDSVTSVDIGLAQAPEPPDPEPEPPVEAGAPTLLAGYGYVEVGWPAVPGAVMYRISRRLHGSGQYQPIETLPGTRMIDHTPAGGQSYDYVVAAKDASGAVQPDSAAASISVPNRAPPEGSMQAINAAIGQAQPGASVDLAPGIYRVSKDGQPQFNKSATLRSKNRDVWFLCSRDWATGGEVGNGWSQQGNYWRSERQAPALNPNPEDSAQISDNTVARFYNNVTVWDAACAQHWLQPIGAGGSPSGFQVCYESGSDRRLRIGTDPGRWARIEVTEALSWGGATASDLTFEGLTFRGAGGGSADASFDVRGRQGVSFKNCVMGSTHSGGITMWQGETNTDARIVVDGCWFDHCGYGPLSASSLKGVTVRGCLFTSTGGQGYNEIWHGGDFKFVGGPRNILIEYCTSYDATGASWWADISATDYEVRYCKTAHNKRFYAFSHEISLNGNVHHNLFWDAGIGTGYPTVHTDQGSGLNFHDNVVVGNDGSQNPSDGRVMQFQGAQSDGSLRPDAPAGGCHDNRFTNNFFIHLGHDCFDWSLQAQGGKFKFDGNTWWSANPLWKFDGYNNNVRDIGTWNNLPDVEQDAMASDAEKDQQLRLWGIGG